MSNVDLYQQSQRGMTMVELLVGLAVGLFLSAGILQIFLSSNQTYRALDAGSRVQENARYALNTLARDIRTAGFLGCRSLAQGVTVLHDDGDEDAPDFSGLNMGGQPLAVLGYENGGASGGADKPWDEFLSSSVSRVDGTDVVQVLYAGGVGAELASDLSPSAGSVMQLVSNPDGLGANANPDLAFITDCAHTSAFSVGEGLTHGGLDRPYQKGAMVFPLVARAYFIGSGGAGCTQSPCLYRWQEGSNPASLVTGVEDLQIRYGEDVDGDGAIDGYTDAAGADFARVVSVRMGLVFSSESEVTTKPQSYVFADPGVADPEPTVSPDRKYRVPYWVTVSLRNALP